MDTAFNFNLADHSLSVHAMTKDWTDRRTAKTTRVYVSLQDGDVPMQEPPVSSKGDDPENDKLWRRYNRLEVAAMKVKIEKALPAIAAACGRTVSLSIDDFRFSRKAGCSCPCSPGFVYDSWISSCGDGPVDIWISGADTSDHQREHQRLAAEYQLVKARKALAEAQSALDKAAAVYNASVAEILGES
jgi:hypothetical protein